MTIAQRRAALDRAINHHYEVGLYLDAQRKYLQEECAHPNSDVLEGSSPMYTLEHCPDCDLTQHTRPATYEAFKKSPRYLRP